MSIFRLLDSATQRGGKDENLCLDRLVYVVKADCPSLGDELGDLLSELRGHMSPFLNLRNQVSAHNALHTTPALYDGTSTVLAPSREVIETVLRCARRFMNAVQKRYEHGEAYYYDATLHEPGDGKTLSRHLTNLAALDDRSE